MKFNCSYDELVNIHELVPHPQNPNIHPDHQIERLAKVIDYQGQRSPVIIDKQSGFIIVGHGRLMAMKSLDWEKVAVNYQEFENEAQAYAHMTADNAIAEWASLDISKINTDFIDMGPELDLEMLGLMNFRINACDEIIGEINKGDENSEWAELEKDEKDELFEPGEGYITLITHFNTELEREVYVKENSIIIDMKKSGQWITRR